MVLDQLQAVDRSRLLHQLAVVSKVQYDQLLDAVTALFTP